MDARTRYDALVLEGKLDEARAVFEEIMKAGESLELELAKARSFSFRPPTPKAPDVFSGTDGKAPDVRTFVRSCDSFFGCFTAMDSTAKKEYVLQLLTGPARMWWHQYELLVARGASPVIETWEQLREALLQQFTVFDEAEKARDYLDRLQHRSSVSVFNFKFNEALLRIPPEQYVDEVYKHMYINKLKEKIQYQVKLAQPDSLVKAMEIADRLDRIRTNGTSDKPSWTRDRGKESYAQAIKSGRSNGSAPMELGALVQRKYKALTEAEKLELLKKKACFYCREPNAGHKAEDCPKKMRDNKKGAKASNSRAQ